EIGLSRIAANEEREINRLDLESLSFHQKVREGYQLLIQDNPDRIVVLDANRPIHMVEQDIVRTLEERVLKGF
ncbi:MAG TPA: dTMP kinase, partial [Paenibacillus sp.]